MFVDLSKKNYRKVIVVLGTTASGKTDLAIELAKKFNGEIISADSRQVYKGMDIGTGKELWKFHGEPPHIPPLTKGGRGGGVKVPYHLIDVISPKRQFTVADFQKRAYKAIEDILSRGKTPILCGGTGLYIDTVVKGYHLSKLRITNYELRIIRKKLKTHTLPHLLKQLRAVDPKTYKIIDKKNRRRVQRALEIYFLTGKTKSEQMAQKKPPYSFLFIGVTFPKDELKKRISQRLKKRFQHGMIAEVRKLHLQGVSWKRLENFGLEYRWVSRFLQKKISEGDLRDGLAKDIISFAKRQMTWFKRNKDIFWVSNRREAVKRAAQFLNPS